MQKKTKKHSKFKNAGMLFELLTRQITSDILAGRDETFTKDILFRYFNENKELGKEVQLYNFIVNQSLKNVKSADRLLDIIIQTRSKLNEQELQRQKYNLIKEIKEKYDIDQFLKNKIPNYRLYASVYKVFENAISKDIRFNVKEINEAKDCIIENLTKDPTSNAKELDLYDSQSMDVKMMAYKFLIENFNKKYSTLLPEQKKLLKEYITNSNNTEKFKSFVNSEIKIIIENLSTLKNDIKNDVIVIKLNETINQLNNKYVLKTVKDSHLSTLMNSYELIHELKNIKPDVVTAFEILEHLVAPYNVLSSINSERLVATIPLNLWFSKAYRSKHDPWDRHYHEFEDWQFNWLLEKSGWEIIDSQKWISRVKINGIRPLLRNFTPRYYAVYAERK